LVLQPALALFLLAKKYWLKYPIFTLYSILNSLGNIGAYLLRMRVPDYFWFVFIFDGVMTLVGLGIAYEIFNRIFMHHRALKRMATLVFAASAVALAGLGTSLIVSKAPFSSTDVMKSVLVVSEAARILEVGLIGVLFLFSRAFGIHWRQATFGIALGLGIVATAELIALTIQSEFGPGAIDILNLVRTGAFDVSLLTWIGYILAPEPSFTIALPERSQLEEWNRAVMEFIQQ
jgi:hypothetical protein